MADEIITRVGGTDEIQTRIEGTDVIQTKVEGVDQLPDVIEAQVETPIWLPADDLSNYYSIGSDIDIWPNHGYHADPVASGTFRPTYISSGTVELDGGNDFFDLGPTPVLPATGDWFIAAAMKWKSDAIGQAVFAQYLASVGNGRILMRASDSTLTGKLALFLGNEGSSGAPSQAIRGSNIVVGEPVLFVTRRKGDTFEVRKNGAVDASHTDSVTRSLLQAGTTIGARSTDQSNYLASLQNHAHVDIYEMIVGLSHTDEQLETLESDLMTSWGIT